MSVNLSARQFVQPDLIDQVDTILSETGLDPTTLELEITESVVMDQSEVGIRTLSRLRDMGVRLVLDDFGTGYSSLSYLRHLPLDTIKIDRTFVAGLAGEADRSIVDAVIALAHGLRISVVAEGIETEAQFEVLRAMGCDVGQGYLFARPLPAVEAGRLSVTESGESPSTRAAPDPGPGAHRQAVPTDRPPAHAGPDPGADRHRAIAAAPRLTPSCDRPSVATGTGTG